MTTATGSASKISESEEAILVSRVGCRQKCTRPWLNGSVQHGAVLATRRLSGGLHCPVPEQSSPSLGTRAGGSLVRVRFNRAPLQHGVLTCARAGYILLQYHLTNMTQPIVRAVGRQSATVPAPVWDFSLGNIATVTVLDHVPAC